MSQQQEKSTPGEEGTDKAGRGDRTSPFEKLGVSPAQVTGVGLAAATAAVLGGQLGIAGTVSGAAMTSVIITLGGAVYQRSLESTKQKAANAALRRAARRRAAQAASAWADPNAPTRPLRRPADSAEDAAARGTGAAGGAQPHDRPGDEATRRIAVPEETRRLSPAGHDPSVDTASVTGGAVEAAGEREGRRGRRGLDWRVVAVTSGLAFVLCMVLVTGYEAVTGGSVSGDSGETTVGNLFRQGDAGGSPAPEERPVRVPASESSTAPETSERTEESQRPSETSDPTSSPERSPSRTPSSSTGSTPETTGGPETSSAEPTPSERPRRNVRPSEPSAP
ncbi:hypothetical protein SAMN04487905_101455 [Actinopolyspora xinjiangensis]|uniref:Uncharacterized protein n=1 Tax=Actinopolyspora xinjiangensis TaxID=405564 RepID=A0A1H0PAL9_9ACTN|nr:hypothetical protein [Actinopolyspora xinjiangensis]SDP01780.1 hypothetical protein SAMN04487905_101455 [Actinopolyspora xinjiangensis]